MQHLMRATMQQGDKGMRNCPMMQEKCSGNRRKTSIATGGTGQ
jgi:hypothetical protein